MNESMVTFQGWLGADVTTRQAGGALVAKFRVGSTPRRLNRSTGEWHDGPTQWYSVSAWRALGDHCARSLRRGDPVVVHGRLTHATWTAPDGAEMSSLEVDASFVGHDLTRGTSQFTRATSRAPREPVTGDQTADVTQGADLSAAPDPHHRVA